MPATALNFQTTNFQLSSTKFLLAISRRAFGTAQYCSSGGSSNGFIYNYIFGSNIGRSPIARVKIHIANPPWDADNSTAKGINASQFESCVAIARVIVFEVSIPDTPAM